MAWQEAKGEGIFLSMRKEVLLAILAGSFLGLILMFGVVRINSALRTPSPANSIPAPSATPKGEFGITLAKPEDRDVVTESPITFSGVTSPDAWVVISTDTDDFIFPAQANGTFSQDVKLSAGVNLISVAAYKNGGQSAYFPLVIVYSSEFSKNTVPSATPASGTSEADIRQKVIQKVEEVLKKPTSYLGTVTDIAAGTLQIKTGSSEIEQISTAASGIAVLKAGKTNKEIKLADIAIGDFVVAMGYKNGNNVLNAQRILSTSPIGSPTASSVYGNVSGIDKKNITISSLTNNQSYTLVYDKKTDTNLAFSKIEEGDLIIAVYTKDTQKARTLFIINGASPSPSASPKTTSSPKASALPKTTP